MKQTIRIDRSKWRTGGELEPKHFGAPKVVNEDNITGKGSTCLLNDDGYMCCLGFVSIQACPEHNYLDVGEPCEVDSFDEIHGLTEDYHEGEHCSNTSLTEDAMMINDDNSTTPQEKEVKLKVLFEDSPYELEFYGEYE